MPKIYLVNVGANRSHENKARSPIFSDGTWIYVPFPHKSTHHSHPFPEATLPYIRVANGVGCHADPDWDGLTYVDSCSEPRAKSLSKVHGGDILLFWSLLWKTDRSRSVFDSHERGWYIIGVLRVESVLKQGDRVSTLLPDIQRRAIRNPHVIEGKIKDKDGERVFIGSSDLRHSRRFANAVDWQVYIDGGLMHRVVRAADGSQIRWHESPQWNSVTRSCRAILDLANQRDHELATFLAERIEQSNSGFDLIGKG